MAKPLPPAEQRKLPSTGNAGLDALADAIADRIIARLNAVQQPALMTVKEAAVYLHRSPRSVYDMVKRGELPHVEQGGRLMLRRVDIDQAIEIATVRG